MEMHQVVLKESQFGIHILQSQDNQIVEEATDLFEGMKSEMEAMSKRITSHTTQLLPHQNTNRKIQDGMTELTNKIDSVNKILASITKSLKEVPNKKELRDHAVLMEEQTMRVQEVNTELTMAMEEYKVSKSSCLNFRQSVPEVPRVTPFVQAGPSGVLPERRGYFARESSVSSLRDTDSASTWLGRMRDGAGSEAARDARGAAGNADGPAGEAARNADGAAGGGNGNAGDPPPPGSDPPSEHGNRNARISQRQGRIQELQYAKPIKIKEPKKFGGKPGEDFDTWWVLIQVYIQGQPEKFPKDE